MRTNRVLLSATAMLLFLFVWHLIRCSIPPEKQAPIVALVELIMAAKKSPVGFDSAQPTTRSLSGVKGNISVFEAEVDRLVYALYGLSNEEIVVVEGKI